MLAVNLALPDELTTDTIALFCDWFEGLTTVDLWEMANAQAEEFRAFRKAFTEHYKKEQG